MPRAEDIHGRNARNASKLVNEVDVRVVREKEVVVAAVGRMQRDKHQGCGRRFDDRHTGSHHVARQLRAGLIDPHLRQDVGHVWIRADLEVHGHTNRPVCVDRLDVVAPVNAAHLLLNRRCDGLLDRLRIGAGVVGADLDLRRNDVRILRDRQLNQRDDADDRH